MLKIDFSAWGYSRNVDVQFIMKISKIWIPQMHAQFFYDCYTEKISFPVPMIARVRIPLTFQFWASHNHQWDCPFIGQPPLLSVFFLLFKRLGIGFPLPYELLSWVILPSSSIVQFINTQMKVADRFNWLICNTINIPITTS